MQNIFLLFQVFGEINGNVYAWAVLLVKTFEESE